MSYTTVLIESLFYCIIELIRLFIESSLLMLNVDGFKVSSFAYNSRGEMWYLTPLASHVHITLHRDV